MLPEFSGFVNHRGTPCDPFTYASFILLSSGALLDHSDRFSAGLGITSAAGFVHSCFLGILSALWLLSQAWRLASWDLAFEATFPSLQGRFKCTNLINFSKNLGCDIMLPCVLFLCKLSFLHFFLSYFSLEVCVSMASNNHIIGPILCCLEFSSIKEIRLVLLNLGASKFVESWAENSWSLCRHSTQRASSRVAHIILLLKP